MKKISYWQFCLPILVWLLMPVNTYAYKHNLPQGNLTCFTTAATYYLLCFYLLDQRKSLYMLLAAMLIVAGVFSNGILAIYPLGFFFIFWLIFRKHNFLIMCRQTVILLFITAPCMMLILSYKPAYHAMSMYFHTQLWASLNEHRIGSFTEFKCLNIVWLLVNNLAPVIFLTFIFCCWLSRKTASRFSKILTAGLKNKWFILFFLFACTVSLPVMLVSRQHGQLYLAGLPFICRGICTNIRTRNSLWLKCYSEEELPFYNWHDC